VLLHGNGTHNDGHTHPVSWMADSVVVVMLILVYIRMDAVVIDDDHSQDSFEE
jgi:hypothetical protein